MEKKLLIAVDESATSTSSLRYVAHLFKDDPDVHFTLINCQSSGAEVIPEPENEAASLMPAKGSGKKHQNSLRLLGKASQKLENLGISKERISTVSQFTPSTPKAIQSYAQQELVDAIIIARRGVGLLGELLLGSVSSELFEKSRSIPLWIIDGDIESRNFFVPVDGTPPSLMAIDHLAHIFSGRTDINFYFFHARSFLSAPPTCNPEDFYDRWGKDWCDTHLSGTGCMYTGPTELFTDAGIPKESIHVLPEPTALEESTKILSTAKKYQCGTIAIGRRPTREVKGILGGVSKRTVIQAEDCALWVIG